MSPLHVWSRCSFIWNFPWCHLHMISPVLYIIYDFLLLWLLVWYHKHFHDITGTWYYISFQSYDMLCQELVISHMTYSIRLQMPTVSQTLTIAYGLQLEVAVCNQEIRLTPHRLRVYESKLCTQCIFLLFKTKLLKKLQQGGAVEHNTISERACQHCIFTTMDNNSKK